MVQHQVFITGGTGYIGQRLIPRLSQHQIRALVRPGAASRLPPSCVAIEGDALDESSFADRIKPADTFVQLVGVSHPSPAKAELFRTVDLASIRASVAAAVRAEIQHFVYVSVAHPAPMMAEYIAVRTEGEALLSSSGLNATVLRPWYVLGPGHRWPYLILPFYWLFECLPSTRASARRLGLVTLNEMLAALVAAVENPSTGFRVVEVQRDSGCGSKKSLLTSWGVDYAPFSHNHAGRFLPARRS